MNTKLKSVLVLFLLVTGLSVTPASAADRVNVWPIYTYEKGAHEFASSLAKYKDSNDWHFFPIFNNPSLFCIFPEFWFGSDQFAVLPFYARYDFSKGALFPVLWWNYHDPDQAEHAIFPLYRYKYSSYGDEVDFWAALGVGGYQRVGGENAKHWLFPLYWSNGDNFASIPYIKVSHPNGEINEAYLCGLAGRNISTNGVSSSHWCFPLYGKTESGFVTIPYTWSSTDDGGYSWWTWPLLTGGHVGPEMNAFAFMLGFAGYKQKDDYFASWLLPLYYKDNERLLITPIYGRTKSSSWLFPLWYGDERSTWSLLWCSKTSEDGLTDKWVIPPFISGGETKEDGSHVARFLFGLGGATWGGPQNKRCSWAFPLYYEDNDGKFYTLLYGKNKTANWIFPLYHYDGENGNFTSILYANGTFGNYTERWLATPLIGSRSGSRTGGWFFPLFNYDKDASYEYDLALLDSPTIPKDITFDYVEHTRTNSVTGEVSVYTNAVESVHVNSRIRGSFLLGSDFDKSVVGHVGGNTYYRLSATSKRGNRLIFNRETKRTAEYNIKSRQKVKETKSSETTALFGLLYSDKCNCDSDGVVSHSRTRILLKFWDREERNGRVSIDAFPGITHESGPDGYSKTSFLWRFYNYERTREGGTNLDLFFIPIRRAK